MTPKEKAKEIIKKCSNFHFTDGYLDSNNEDSKEMAVFVIENEYHSLREQLVNLRSCRVIEDFSVYNHRLNELIEEEQSIINEINAQ